MNKIALEILTLSQSIALNQTYTIILGEVKGKRRLPIVIGNPEARAIALAIENMSPQRPQTHDLIKNIMDTFDVHLKEILISQVLDGIFYSKLICIKEHEEVTIDARTSDAIALAVRFGCPIYTNPSILESSGIYLDDSAEENSEEEEEFEKDFSVPDEISQSSYSILTMKELETQLDEALNDEDYERAARVRDEINKRRKD